MKTIVDDAFSDCKNLKRVDLGNRVETIGKNAFKGAPLERIAFPDSVKLIDRQAFFECKQLVDVNLGKGVEKIGFQAFAFTAIEQITIPRSVNKIDDLAFAQEVLKNVDFQDEGKIEFGDRPFAWSPYEKKWEKTAEKREQEERLQKQQEEELKKLSDVNKSTAEPTEIVAVTHESSLLKLKPENFVVESGVIKRIALGTLNFLKREKERLGNQFKISVVNFPDDATEIAEFFFMELGYDNLNFGEVNFGKNLKKIGKLAFRNAKFDSSLVFPCSLKEIGESAFCGTSIKNLQLPDSVEEIGEHAFYGCKNLTSVSFGSQVKTIGDDAFFATAITDLKIPDLVEIMHFTPSEFTSLKTLVLGKNTKKITVGFTLDKIVVPQGNDIFRMLDGNLYDYYFFCLIAASRKDVGKTVCIPENVERIEANTFDHCENLLTVDIQPTRLEYIDDCCFIGKTPKIVRVPYKGLFAPKWVKTIFPKGVKIEKLK